MAEAIHVYNLAGIANVPDVEISWNHADQEAALAEGWFLDEEDGAICTDEEAGTFASDPQAHEHVNQHATAGSELHIRAMILDAWAAVGAWESRYRETTGQRGDWHAP